METTCLRSDDIFWKEYFGKGLWASAKERAFSPKESGINLLGIIFRRFLFLNALQETDYIKRVDVVGCRLLAAWDRRCLEAAEIIFIKYLYFSFVSMGYITSFNIKSLELKLRLLRFLWFYGAYFYRKWVENNKIIKHTWKI